eukprot:6672165-Pyramimonas_sp.AAC.1
MLARCVSKISCLSTPDRSSSNSGGALTHGIAHDRRCTDSIHPSNARMALPTACNTYRDLCPPGWAGPAI